VTITNDDTTAIFDVCQYATAGGLCGVPLPDGRHPNRKYCDEHQPKQSKPKKKTPTGDDVPPRTVNVNIKTPTTPKRKGDADAEAVRAGATVMLGFLPMAFAMAGDSDCAQAINDSIPAIAHQLGELSIYHPGLKKIFAPMESSGEAMAWIGLTMALAPVLVSVLAHHKLIPPALATTIAGMFGGVAQAGNASGH